MSSPVRRLERRHIELHRVGGLDDSATSLWLLLGPDEQDDRVDEWPLVTVGLPVYNGEASLAEALDSVLGQDYPNLRVLISDNGSTDGTESIARDYAARYRNVDYRRSSQNRGASWNFTHLLLEATSPYFMWAAHDDRCQPNFVSECVRELEADDSVAICHCHVAFTDSTGRVTSTIEGIEVDAPTARERYRFALGNWTISGANYGLFRTSMAQRTRGILLMLSSDMVFMCEMMIEGKLRVLPATLQEKQVPDLGVSYRSPTDLYSYLAGRPTSLRKVFFLRLRMLLQCGRGVIRQRGLSPAALGMLLDTGTAYVRHGYWRVDLRETGRIVWERLRQRSLSRPRHRTGENGPD